MRKNYIYFVLLLLVNISMFGQKVTLTPTLVNGVGFSTGSINLASIPTSTISLSIKVEIPSTAAVGNQGTIKIYFSKGSALGSNIATGGDGGALYFGGGQVATRNFLINLNWNDFLTSGGFIFAEYNNNGIAYKSSNIPVVKNSTVNTGTNLNPPADAPNPNKIVNTLCCNQTIRLGEKPAPITGSQYLNPYEGLPYGITYRITVDNGQINNYDDLNKTLYLDYTTELKDITINKQLGYVYGGQLPNKSNTVTIKVVPSPISNNKIFSYGSVNPDESIEISISNPKDIFGDPASINLNVLQDPYYVPKRGDNSKNIQIEKYEWEYRITNGTSEEYTWKTIPNQFSASLNSSYLPRNNSKDNFYNIRRIAIYQNLRLASNSLKISLRGIRDNNTICCDQTLQMASPNEIETPSMITGTTAISNKNTYLQYNWQRQIVSDQGLKFSNWVDIPNAKSKDYTPPPLEFIPASGNTYSVTTYNYRRIATDNTYKGEEYYSNEIRITPSTNTGYLLNPLILYPNPATTIINIENPDSRSSGGPDLINAVVNIVDIMGNTLNSYYLTVVNPKLITIDISNLAIGTYFVNVQTTTRSSRKFTQQFTLIKKN